MNFSTWLAKNVGDKLATADASSPIAASRVRSPAQTVEDESPSQVVAPNAKKPRLEEHDTISARPAHYAQHSPDERDQFLALKKSIGLPDAVWQWETQHSTAPTTLYNWSEAEDRGTLPAPGVMRRPGAGRPVRSPPKRPVLLGMIWTT